MTQQTASLTKDAIRAIASAESFRRGQDYYRAGLILRLVQRGDDLHALVAGSADEPYRVTIGLAGGVVTGYGCSCPYDQGGACKHIVAVLLAAVHEPEHIEARPPLAKLLAGLDARQLREMLLQVAQSSADLFDMIEDLAASLNPVAPEDGEARLEQFIQDWHWDELSHEFARQAGRFVFQFIATLQASGIAEQTLRKHASNCQLIGYFECQYGGTDRAFSPPVFAHGPTYQGEFRRKVSDSPYMLASYEATWRKLSRYVQSLGYGAG